MDLGRQAAGGSSLVFLTVLRARMGQGTLFSNREEVVEIGGSGVVFRSKSQAIPRAQQLSCFNAPPRPHNKFLPGVLLNSSWFLVPETKNSSFMQAMAQARDAALANIDS